MNWGGVSAFLAMGGYAGFIWGSYGVTAACMALEITQPFALGARELAEAANIDRLEADSSTDTPRQKVIIDRSIVFEVERIAQERVGCTGIGDQPA